VSLLKFLKNNINIQDSALEKGSHWCVIWAQNPATACWFDSFGERPPAEIKEYIDYNFKKLQINPHKFQSVFSNTCGHFCIAFIYFMSIGFDFSSVIKMFRKCNDPDKFVSEFLNNSFS
jgi:hypothetical protein